MARSSHTFQAPKGTRDFYPGDMHIRRWMESVWARVSRNHGFDEIEGPTFEHLDLYTLKSGEGIVSELFSFTRAGGDTDYALRPEFTPTLARMYAARAGQLPKPVRWFCMPQFFRAERPQRGRLREFQQWNIDIVGDDSAKADAQVIACAVDVLREFGLSGRHITVKVSNRHLVTDALATIGVAGKDIATALGLLDKRDRMDEQAFNDQCAAINLDATALTESLAQLQDRINGAHERLERAGDLGEALDDKPDLRDLLLALHACGVLEWCETDLSIVRGLAYYTGTVFEIHASSGKERAIAGGGRYDGLVELVGGPPTPAVGIAMGDVVLRLVLEDLKLLPDEQTMRSALGVRPDAFVISSGTEEAEAQFQPLIAALRRAGLHVRHSDKATRNVGKLLGDAGKSGARFAVILGDELATAAVMIKDMDSGEQEPVALADLQSRISPRAS